MRVRYVLSSLLLLRLAGLHENKMYIERCGRHDNGRLKTWLPYRRSEDSSALVHYVTGETLLGEQEEKYYAYWYAGPQVTHSPRPLCNPCWPAL